ncbi:putative peptide modification system cyclase [Coralloluteibacterium thermophilus]|uniref:Peptide modification system cyclase n=1 Tax=Coralloluteibacterium thermophilum TaxID=2707049 RepID=A0ABV9NIL9_9GAMM
MDTGSVIEERPPEADAPSARLCVVLVCDLVDSTALIERLGDLRGAALLRRHDQLARDLLDRHGGQVIDKSDGYLALFERPVQAVAFALDYQRALHEFQTGTELPLRARVGIHVGDMVVWSNRADVVAAGGKPVEVEGLAKPVAARLMTLALPGQILLSGMAFNLAQRAAAELETAVTWRTHGRYRFKGTRMPMLVHEVGEPGLAPLRVPPSQDKARREVPLWRRPATFALEAVAAAVLLTVLFVTLHSTPAIAFRERDWVVLADVQNLTGDPRFEDALQTALRVSLEQSNYVNVLPDLRVRDALQRMQRPPDTALDRSVAAEIAQREGARAVVLPVVAEVGGRLEMSLQVVHPQTGAVVHTEVRRGDGADALVAALGGSADALRAYLGEPGAAAERLMRLEQITTGNLEALRAYSLAQKAAGRGLVEEADVHFRQALTLDPDFAMAKIGLARLLQLRGEVGQAAEWYADALRHEGRLSQRERLYAEAHVGTIRHEAGFAERWKGLAELYPDFEAAALNAALYAHVQGRYEDVREFGRRTAALGQRGVAFGLYLEGLATAILEGPEAAAEPFQRAAAHGLRGFEHYPAALQALLGEHEAAVALLEKSAPAGEYKEAEHLSTLYAVQLSAGAADEARALRERVAMLLSASAHASTETARRTAMLLLMTLHATERQRGSTPSDEPAWRRMQQLARVMGAETYEGTTHRVYAAYAAASVGEHGLAAELMGEAEPGIVDALAFLRDLRAVVEASAARARGDLVAASEALASTRTRSTPVLRAERAELLRAEGDAAAASAELAALARDPARAWYDWGGEGVFRVENVLLWQNAAHGDAIPSGDGTGPEPSTSPVLDEEAQLPVGTREVSI